MTELARKIREGDTRALARAATGVENSDPQALETLRELEPAAGHARIVGITGPPGAGKSTLVDALAAELRRHGKTIAILAVDPSSRTTGGAILGDRIRMQRHHADPGIFIRSMAARGTMGGLARATADLARLMDAAGRDYVLIETVGVGQDEIAIASVAHLTVVVLVPGMGDDVQAIKAGIMEIADIFVINKSDRPGADRVELDLHSEGFTCPVLRTVATQAKGIAELVAAIETAPSPIRAATVRERSSPAFYQTLVLAGDARIELLTPTAERGPGLHHIALRVADLDAALSRLQAGGARLIDQPRSGAGGHTYVFVHPASTGGVLLELIQENKP
jgi:LAO/AO transport system kinase